MSNRVEKPWGWYEDLERRDSYVVKKIYVNPNQRFSLQKHSKREEFWIILNGQGIINVDGYLSDVGEGDFFHIKKNQIHRLQSKDKGITFIEVQKGECQENDIVRLEDDYNRLE